MTLKAAYQRARRARLKAAAQGGGQSKGEPSKTEPVKAGVKVYDVNEGVTLRADDPGSIEQLRAMASRGELPLEVLGSTDGRERIFEEIARLYGDPPGILGEYELVPIIDHNPNLVGIRFTTNDAIIQGINVRDVKYLKKGQGSELSRRGQVNYEILKARKAAEGAASFRGTEGFPNRDFAQKWGGRILSNREKEQANQEIHQFLERVFKSPLSKSGREYVDAHWERMGDGWVRTGSTMAMERRMDKLQREAMAEGKVIKGWRTDV